MLRHCYVRMRVFKIKLILDRVRYILQRKKKLAIKSKYLKSMTRVKLQKRKLLLWREICINTMLDNRLLKFQILKRLKQNVHYRKMKIFKAMVFSRKRVQKKVMPCFMEFQNLTARKRRDKKMIQIVKEAQTQSLVKRTFYKLLTLSF